jgi:TolB-like protein
VLPFIDLSPEGNQAWFADGVAEEILNVLAKTNGLKVASRTASFHFRGEGVDLKQAAQELNVSNILEGSVRSQGDRLRITAQLISAEDGFHLWSETFDRELSDIFLVQDEISVSIATALFGELGIQALPQHRFEETRNLEAYTYYLQGMEKISNAITLPLSKEAILDFQKAIELDPEFANAWVGLVRAENFVSQYGLEPPTVSPSLKTALVMSPENSDAIAELAFINSQLLRWHEAEQLFQYAISLDPENDRFRVNFGEFLRISGRVNRALEQFLIADQLGSMDRRLNSLIVNTHAYLGQFAEARAFFEKRVEEVGLQKVGGKEAYVVSLLADGMEEEARAFSQLDLPNNLARARIQFFIDRIDGNEQAHERFVSATFDRIERTGFPRAGDVENFLLAGEIELAREYALKIWGAGWGVPHRFSLFVNDEIDPRYLNYRGNQLLISDLYPGAIEAFMDVGVDILAKAKEKGFLSPQS